LKIKKRRGGGLKRFDGANTRKKKPLEGEKPCEGGFERGGVPSGYYLKSSWAISKNDVGRGGVIKRGFVEREQDSRKGEVLKEKNN